MTPTHKIEIKPYYQDKRIISFSGGKDSTALAIMYPEYERVFFDTGWEFPEMYEHIKKFNPTILKPRHNFDDLVIKYSWPWMTGRWCSREKIDAIDKYVGSSISLIGFTLDEAKRTNSKEMRKKLAEFPLIENSLTDKQALNYCYAHGHTWNGLYEKIDKRISCYCCPLKGSPKVWKRIRHFILSYGKRCSG